MIDSAAHFQTETLTEYMLWALSILPSPTHFALSHSFSCPKREPRKLGAT
jgi:hypothetical protein